MEFREANDPLVTRFDARFLEAQKKLIIDDWESRVCREIPAARHQTESALRDSLPEFLERLFAALESGRPPALAEAGINDVSVEHGDQRAGLPHYTIHQMLAEYRFLREVIFERLEAREPLRPAARDLILTAIEQGMTEAGARFMGAVRRKEAVLHERYRQLVESITDHAILSLDRDGIITDWNPGAEKITGHRRDEVVGKPGAILFTAEDLANGADEREMRTARETGKAEDRRWHLRKDGSRFFASGAMNPVRDERGERIGYVKVFRDQTEELVAKEERERLLALEKQLLVAAESAHAELQSFIMQAPAGMVIVSGPNHKFTLANPMYEKLVGRKVAGKTVLEAFTEEEVAHFVPLLDGVYRTGKPYIGTELPLNIPDETGAIQHRFVNVAYHPFHDLDGTIKGILAVAQDVTAQVRARNLIAESDRRYREIANVLPTIVWTATPDGHVDWYSDWWYEYTGYPRGTRWDDSEKLPMHPEDVARTWPLWKESLRTGKTFEMEQRFRRGSDGEYRWHLVRGVPVRDASGRITKWIGSNADIQDHKLAVEKLKEEQLIREKFVATLSHDLRTPLAAARMSAQLVERNPATVAANRKLSRRIIDNMDRADDMIRDLLDVSRIKAGEPLPIEWAECDLAEIARATLDELTTLHGNRFRIKAPNVLNARSSCDGFRRILENLCNNAIKYGSTQAPITVTLEGEIDSLRLSVHNVGNPISIAEQKQLFDPYMRTGSAKAGKEKGWGLGLTLVKGIADALGGSADVESSPERGTTFRVQLPRTLVE